MVYVEYKHIGSNLKPYEALFNNFIKHCKSRNITTSLDYVLFLSYCQQTICHYCHGNISFARYNLNKNGHSYNLDRKDNTVGYIADNIVPCCWRCNNGKSDVFTYEEWYNMCSYLRKQNKHKS